MKITDAMDMAQYNLRRAILRTILTTLGVIIGIATLSSMVSFGAGMEENIVSAFKKNDLFTSIFVTSTNINLKEMAHGEKGEKSVKKSPPLNDSTLAEIQNINGVEIAFPEVSFPASLELDTNSVKTSIQALPANMKDYPPYDDLAWGKFLSSDSAREIVLSQRMLRRLKIIVKDKDDRKLKSSDISSGMRLLPPDSIIGRRIDLVTAVLSAKKAKQMAGQMMMGAMMGRADFNKTREINPFENKKHEFIITGILKKTSPMGGGRMSSNAIIPIKQAAIIPRTSINSVWDVLGEKKGADSAANVYNSIYVRAESVTDMEKIRSKLEAENYNIFSLADQMDDIRNAFIFIDAILGTIGIVALIVAALGIINTMVMSILERKKEIGVMKAIGGGEGDIRLIFFVEATVIGVVGGALGLAAGWVFTSIANLIINGYLKPPTESPIDMFYFPVWLIAGAMIFSVCVSLAAGLYPAYRAARVDPVEALRHD